MSKSKSVLLIALLISSPSGCSTKPQEEAVVQSESLSSNEQVTQESKSRSPEAEEKPAEKAPSQAGAFPESVLQIQEQESDSSGRNLSSEELQRDAQEGLILAGFYPHAIAWSGDASLVCAVNWEDAEIEAFDPKTEAIVTKAKKQEMFGSIIELVSAPQSNSVAALFEPKTLAMLDAQSMQSSRSTTLQQEPSHLAVSPRGSLIAVSFADSETIALLRSDNLELAGEIQLGESFANQIVFLSEDLLATHTHSNIVQVWNAKTFALVYNSREELGNTYPLGLIAPLSESRLLVANTFEFSLLDLENKKLQSIELEPSSDAWAVSADGKWLANTSSDGKAVEIYDATDFKKRQSFEYVLSHSSLASGIHQLSFSPDGQYLAANDSDGIRLWRTPEIENGASTTQEGGSGQ